MEEASAIWLKDIELVDPETGNVVTLGAYYDPISCSVFGIDASWPDRTVRSPYNPHCILILEE